MTSSEHSVSDQAQDTSPETEEPTTGPQDVAEVGPEAARLAWAAAAREVLVELAGTYQAVITHKELAQLVMERSGVTTRQLSQHWIGDVLVAVGEDSVARDEPILSALVVDALGSVGKGYAAAGGSAAKIEPAELEDADDRAAIERFKCYELFGATMPEDGGRAALTPRLARSRERQRAARIAAIEPTVCPSCNFVVPPTGVCDNCG